MYRIILVLLNFYIIIIFTYSKKTSNLERYIHARCTNKLLPVSQYPVSKPKTPHAATNQNMEKNGDIATVIMRSM